MGSRVGRFWTGFGLHTASVRAKKVYFLLPPPPAWGAVGPPQALGSCHRVCYLHVRASAWLSLLRSAELEGMVRQRLIPRLADGCARMPAPLKDILSCGDPVRARVIAPPQGSCHRATVLYTCVRVRGSHC